MYMYSTYVYVVSLADGKINVLNNSQFHLLLISFSYMMNS